MQFPRIVCLGVALSLAALVGSTTTAGAVADPVVPYVLLPGSAYRLAPGDEDLGIFPDDAVRFEASLKLRDAPGAQALAYAVSDPADRAYGKFLTSAAFRAQFAPTDAMSDLVTGWLTQSGLRITYNPANHFFVAAQGTVRAANRAFRTDIHRVRDATGAIFSAPLRPLLIPANVVPVVDGFIEGINHASRLAHPLHVSDDAAPAAPKATRAHTSAQFSEPANTTGPAAVPPPDALVNAGPCSAYWGQKEATGLPDVTIDYASSIPYAPCGYNPAQLQGAYGTADLIKAGTDGTGVVVAVIDAYASPLIRQDIASYAEKNGPRPWAANQFRQILPRGVRYGYSDRNFGDLCGEQGWYGEETLDIEAVHAMAPGATVLYAGAPSCQDSDLLGTLNDVIDEHLADVITNSWGGIGDVADPVLANAYHAVFLEAAIVGTGVFFASGDNGDENDNSGARTVDYPASDPWVTAVGGTSLGIGKNNDYLFEAGWGTTMVTLEDGVWVENLPGTFLYGAGGGTSRVFDQPKYQRGIVPSEISRYFEDVSPGRAVPDIAAVADPQTGFLVGQRQTFPDGQVRYSEYRIGGTSLASPVMAGLVALSNQAAGRPLGFVNPALYQLGASAHHDIVDPAKTLSVVRVNFANGIDDVDGLFTSLRTMNQTQTLFTRTGYDDVTGIGTPNGKAFVKGLAQAVPAALV